MMDSFIFNPAKLKQKDYAQGEEDFHLSNELKKNFNAAFAFFIRHEKLLEFQREKVSDKVLKNIENTLWILQDDAQNKFYARVNDGNKFDLDNIIVQLLKPQVILKRNILSDNPIEVNSIYIDNRYLIVDKVFQNTIKTAIKFSTADKASRIKKNDHSNSEKLVWSGKKIHLLELIMALHLWNGIKDQNGKIATQGQLVDLFNSMFTFTGAKPIDKKGFSGQILQYYEKHKVALDNEFHLKDLDSVFISHLKGLIIENKDERLEKKNNK